MKRSQEEISERTNVAFKRAFEHVDGNWPSFVYIPGRSQCHFYFDLYWHDGSFFFKLTVGTRSNYEISA